jgi:hypothetical protein
MKALNQVMMYVSLCAQVDGDMESDDEQGNKTIGI